MSPATLREAVRAAFSSGRPAVLDIRVAAAYPGLRQSSWSLGRLPEAVCRRGPMTVGVVGLGAIGRAVIRRLAGFGCRILAVEPSPDAAFCERYGVRCDHWGRSSRRSTS